MKYSILLICFLFLMGCSSNKSVYWCGDHQCVNKSEKESYFKKTMIVEVRTLNTKSKIDKTDTEKIMLQTINESTKITKEKKNKAKQDRLEEKRIIKEQKELSKQVRLEQKLKIKEEKELEKQARLEKKLRIKEEKKLEKHARLKKKALSKKSVKDESKSKIKLEPKEFTSDILKNEFNVLVEKITKRNMFRPYPNINDAGK